MDRALAPPMLVQMAAQMEGQVRRIPCYKWMQAAQEPIDSMLSKAAPLLDETEMALAHIQMPLRLNDITMIYPQRFGDSSHYSL